MAALASTLTGQQDRVTRREVLSPVDGVVNRVPVSYTHLRAHETVLDLVCRLLLEKKKQRRTHCTQLSIQSAELIITV